MKGKGVQYLVEALDEEKHKGEERLT